MTRKKRGASRGTEPTYHSDNQFVSVYCEGIGDRQHSKWMVATFVPVERDGSAVWALSPTGYSELVREDLVKTTPIAGRSVQWLIEDEWVPADKSPFESKPSGYRERWNLTCGKCSLSKVTADPQSLYPAITLTALQGIREITLEHFVHANTKSSPKAT